MEEKVSIIVPVYNVKDYIVETLESVRAQTYGNWELLLVLDGCTDGTASWWTSKKTRKRSLTRTYFWIWKSLLTKNSVL